jgi:hypothetical protein
MAKYWWRSFTGIDRGGWDVLQAQSGQRVADQRFELRCGAGLEQFLGAVDQVRVANIGRDGQVEAGTLEVSILVDRSCVDGIPDQLERQRDKVAGHHRLQHDADQAVQFSKAEPSCSWL